MKKIYFLGEVSFLLLLILPSCSDDSLSIEKESELQTRYSTSPNLKLDFDMPLCLMGTAMDPNISGIDANATVYIIGRIGDEPDYINIDFRTSQINCAKGTFDFGRYSINQNHNIHFYVPGKWHFMAITEYEPLQYPLESPVFTVEVQFPVVFEIMKAVKSDLDRLWSETHTVASEESRQEKGFWVYAKLDKSINMPTLKIGETFRRRSRGYVFMNRTNMKY